MALAAYDGTVDEVQLLVQGQRLGSPSTAPGADGNVGDNLRAPVPLLEAFGRIVIMGDPLG